MPALPLPELIAQVQAHYAASRWFQGRQAAEQAWALLVQEAAAGGACAEDARRREVGLLVCQGRYRTGALTEMVELGLELAPLVRAGGASVALVDFLRMLSLGSADTYRFDLALASAQEALQVAQALGEPASVSLATTALACVFERNGDPWQAERLLREALEQARAQPQEHPVFVALNNLAGVLIGKHYLLRDAVPLAEALEPLEQALPHAQAAAAIAERSGDPFFLVFTQGNLGELLVHLGRHDDAQRSLRVAETLARAHGFHAQVWRLTCTLGELALGRGDHAEARRQLHAVLGSALAAEHPNAHLRAHHALWRIAAAEGCTGEALQHLQAYMAMERARSVNQLRSQSDLFVTRMEVEQARQDLRRHRQRVRQLEVDVQLDPLTGLGNRRAMQTRWPLLMRRALDEAAPLAVAVLDLDHFKQVNDVHGHPVGDRVLTTLATLLRAHTRTADLLVRMGGEEFLLVMPDTPAASALEVCERLRQQIAAHPWTSTVSPGLHVTVSLGLACSPPLAPQELPVRADLALYRAKGAGRNSLVQAEPDGAALPSAAD